MISVVALWMSQKEATSKLTYGYMRAEIVGALFSVFLIWGLTIWLVYEAIDRLINPQEVDGEIMFIVACCGVHDVQSDEGHSECADGVCSLSFGLQRDCDRIDQFGRCHAVSRFACLEPEFGESGTFGAFIGAK